MEPNMLFITASRKKLRFPTGRGETDTEALWDLSLEDLDRMAIALDEKVNKSGKSFIGKRDSTASSDVLRFEIVKFVIETRLAEAERAKERSAAAGRRRLLTSLRDAKQMEELSKMSVDELDKEIAALGDGD